MKKNVRQLLLMLSFLFFVAGCVNDTSPVFSTDAERFQYEYESVNGKRDAHGEKSRKLEILEDNPMIYSSFTDIIDRMDAKETFIVYFGFAKCPWCRGYLEALLASAQECGIDTIYYVDVYTNRDTFEIKRGEAVKTYDGAEGYASLIDKLEGVLENYVLIDENDNEIEVGEKRIYAPNVIAVKDGIAVGIASDSGLFEDAYGEITDEIFADMCRIYFELFALIS